MAGWLLSDGRAARDSQRHALGHLPGALRPYLAEGRVRLCGELCDSALTDGEARHVGFFNALTRLRFCTPLGVMDLKAGGGLNDAPEGYMPWFDVPGRRTADVAVAFGHWSTLGWFSRPDVLGLDTGCVWGGWLTAMRLDVEEPEYVTIKSDRKPAPGKEMD